MKLTLLIHPDGHVRVDRVEDTECASNDVMLLAAVIRAHVEALLRAGEIHDVRRLLAQKERSA